MGRNGVQVIPMSSDLEEEKFRVTGKQVVKKLAGRLFLKKYLIEFWNPLNRLLKTPSRIISVDDILLLQRISWL